MPSSSLGSRINKNKALELANLVLLAYETNKAFMSKDHEAPDELVDLFPSSLACSSDPKFDATYPEHLPTESYAVISWLWHTDRPLNAFHLLKTLPFGFIAANHAKKSSLLF